MVEAKFLSRDEIKKNIDRQGIAILPLGSTEQHGHHLPLGTDSILAESFAKEIAKKVDAIIFPTIEFGYSWVWNHLPGTITLSQSTLNHVLKETLVSLVKMGYKKIVIVNGHDSNKMAIKYAIRELVDEVDAKILNIFYPSLSEAYSKYLESDTWYGMFHADEFETSLMLHFHPELVDMSKACKEYPHRPSLYGYDESSLNFISKSGVYGDATVATAEKGKLLCDYLARATINLIEEMQKR